VKTCPKCFYENGDDSRFCQKCGTNLSSVEGNKGGDPLVGKLLAGNFAVKRKLAVGGMGSIYEAEQVSLQKAVCIKVLHKHLLRDNTIIKRFHREARAASKLKHPNCINVIDFGQAENGVLYLAMDFVQGKDLAEVLEAEHPLGAERVVHIMSQVAGALDEAHAQGIIHRDLKPENIMVEQRRSQPDFVTVLDFGIAKIKEPGKEDRETFQTMAGVVCGTPEYMSPEQIRGEELDARSDLYSFGVIMWQLFTNRLPFSGSTPIATVTKHLTETAPPPSRFNTEIPGPLEALTQRLMSKNRNERPASALEIKQKLDEIADMLKHGGALKGSRYTDLDRTIVDFGQPFLSDERKAVIDQMSLGAEGGSPAAAQAPAQPGRGAPVTPTVVRPVAQRLPGGARPAPKPPSATPVRPAAEPARPIRDPMQQAIDAMGGAADVDDELSSLTPLRRSGRLVWALLLVLALGAVLVGVFMVLRGKGEAPAATEGAAQVAPLPVPAEQPAIPAATSPDVVDAGAADAGSADTPADAGSDAARDVPVDTASVKPPPAEAPRVASTAPTRVTTPKPAGGSGVEPTKPIAATSKPRSTPYEEMGDQAFKKSAYAEAKAYYNLALKHSPNASLHKKIGYCYKSMGRLDDAKAAFGRYLEGLSPGKRRVEEEILKGQGLL